MDFPIHLTLSDSQLDQIQAAGIFSQPLSTLIKTYKYQGVQDIGSLLAKILYQTIVFPPLDVITWVPLHPTKYRQRGFNQSELIAYKLSQLLGIPYQPLLIRTKRTPAQATITDRQERAQSQHQTFSLHPNASNVVSQLLIPPQSKLRAPRVLLIDDVITTGATMNECAIVLKNQNLCSHVYGLAIAHGR